MTHTRISCVTTLPQVGTLSATYWEGSTRSVSEASSLHCAQSDPEWRSNWRQHGDTFLAQARNTGAPILFIVDEFPDMLLNLSREGGVLLREFLAWFRIQRQSPAPSRDSIRWLVGGSVNLAGTLDARGLVDLINDFEDVALPPLTDEDVKTFTTEMLSGRDVPFDDDVPQRLINRLAVPFRSSCRWPPRISTGYWKREQRRIVAADVDAAFDALIVGSATRTRLQHFHSRIGQYYMLPDRSIAHTLLGQISVSDSGLRRATLFQETERALADMDIALVADKRRQLFNRLLLDLENDFYIIEIDEEIYDFASGVLKVWWRKYHA